MLIYNVTVQVERSIAADWLQWLREEHIPRVMQTGCFLRYQVVKLLEPADEADPTYAVQYYVEGQALLNRYLEVHAAGLRAEGTARWGDRFVAFRTIMEVVN
jgi:hypothetical protein